MSHDVHTREIVARRHFGKTLIAAKTVMQTALVNPGFRCWFIAPNRQQAEIVFDLLVRSLRPILKKEPNYTDLQLEIDNGSAIECKVPVKTEVRDES